MNTLNAIRDLKVAEDKRKATCPYCTEGRPCHPEHKTVVLGLGILCLTPEEVTAFMANPKRLAFQRTTAFNNRIYRKTGPMLVVNSKDKMALGVGLVIEAKPDFFEFSEMTLLHGISLDASLVIRTIIPLSARPYKAVRSMNPEWVESFRTFVISIFPQPSEKSEAQYLDEYPTPLLVYIESDEKYYFTLKKSLLFREHSDYSAADETAVELMMRHTGNRYSVQEALRHINIANGEFKDISLWHMYNRLPGCMDKAGIIWSPEQEECMGYFRYMSIRPPLNLIIQGFPEDSIQLQSNFLFSMGGANDLTPQDVVYRVTAAILTFKQAIRVMLVWAPDCIGHNQSLEDICKDSSTLKQTFIGRPQSEINNTIELRLQGFLEAVRSAPDKRQKADGVQKLFQLYITDALEYLNKIPKMKAAAIERAYYFKMENVTEFPELEPVLDNFLRAVNSLYATDVPEATLKATFQELSTTTAAVVAAYPELKESHEQIEANWNKWRKMPRNTPELSAKFKADAQRLEKYIGGLKTMV
jgi:hypothetical protein